MEMPEGWKRVSDGLEKETLKKTQQLGYYMPFISYPDALQIRDLMKEMAEALEICHLGATVFDEKKEEYLYPCDVALAALKKFKEWK